MAEVRILNSWKDISAYIGRGVRTVQRWEELYGLPVHRAAGRDRSAVYALSDEIDAWLRMGKMHDAPAASRDVTPEAAHRYRELMEQTNGLVERLRVLREKTTEIRATINRNRQAREELRRQQEGPLQKKGA